MNGVLELLVLMFLGLLVLVPAVIVVVVVSNRRAGRLLPPDFPPGTAVISGDDGVRGVLVRTDNDYAVIEVDGARRFVPRGSLRPATAGPGPR